MAFSRSGNITSFISGDVELFDEFKAGFVKLTVTMQGVVQTFAGDKPYELPDKVYGDSAKRVERIFTAWESRRKNTGVLLSGVKGSGKSLLLKMLCNKALSAGLPIFEIRDCEGLSAQITTLIENETRGVIIIDEFEKVCPAEPIQDKLLSFMDGTTHTDFLFILTVNQTSLVSDNMLNRTGRIYYHYQYEGLPIDVIREVVMEKLKGRKSHKEKTIEGISALPLVTFDTLSTIIHEMNLFKCSLEEAVKVLNVESTSRSLMGFGRK